MIAAALYSAPPQRWVGGEAMTLALLKAAQRAGHEVRITCQAWGQAGEWNGIPIIPGNARHDVRHLLKQADIVVTHPELTTAHHFERIGLVHNLNPRTLDMLHGRSWRAVIANSLYTQLALPVDSTLIYPPTFKPKVEVDRKYVFVTNLSEDKGAGVVRQAAQDLDYPFLGVLGGYNPQDTTINMTYMGHGPLDMGFANARVMLAPSKSETYGMAVAEATLLGIPVVASDIPAHREVLGEHGILVPSDADQSQWNAAIEKAWHQEPSFERARVLEARTQTSINDWLALLDRHSPTP